jgi:hypothetical protein
LSEKEGRQPKNDKELARGFFCDISQSISRQAWGDLPLRTLLQGSVLYFFEFDSILRPHQHLCLQGWSSEVQHNMLSDNQVRSMAGEAFCLPSLATALWAGLLVPAGSWW